MDRSEENEQPFCTLIKTLILHGVLSESQLNQGLQRIEDKLDEIVLDVPRAKEIFTRFSDRLANS